MTAREKIAKAFRDMRESRGESQATVAARAGIPQQHLSKLEAGGNVTVVTLEAVAKALHCTLDVNLMPRKRDKSTSKNRP